MKRGAAFLFVAAMIACDGGRESPAGVRVAEYANGRWFNGAAFDSATWFVAGDSLIDERPSRVDTVIDLKGKWVVPPFAEGHNHWLEPKTVDAYVQSYLREGIFYLKDQANAPVVRRSLDSALNKPATIDFISANQGFTGSGGHPVQIAKQFLAFGSFPREWTEKDLNGNVYFAIDSLADLDRAWPRFMEGHPDFVKVFLLYSEEYERRRRDPAFQYKRGINPAFVAPIVERAHKAGLRVSAHVYTAQDFHNAVASGVDDIAHMPGTGFDSTLGPDAFLIRDADAAIAGKRNVTVMTTLSWLSELDSAARMRIVSDIIRPNISTLRRANVRILIGSDAFRGNTSAEADLLVSLGLFTRSEVLKMWSVETPRAIFPKRRIGKFAPGYEASFLILDCDPLENLDCAHRILSRVKRGRSVPAIRAVEFPGLDG